VNKSSVGAIIAVTIPLACAIIFGLMCYSQYRDRDLARAAEAQQKSQVDALIRQRETISTQQLTTKHLAALSTPDEQAQFLTQLRMNAQSANIKLVEYRNMGQVMARRQDPNQRNASQSIYRPVASALTVQGPYQGVRAFAYSLLRSDRLMNMNGVSWKRDPDGRTTTLSFTLTRYVTDPSTSVETKTVPMAEKGSAGGASA
jgi:hypothetical protein